MQDAKVERIKGYRYPAPGSQTTANVPTLTNEDVKYDIKYFSRNTRRAGHLDAEGKSNRFNEKFLGKGEIALIDDDAPLGSPGNHYTADTVAEYDPSKLRSAMTATHEETYKAIQSHMPDHLVTYDWEEDVGYEGVIASYEAKGLPPTPGPADDTFVVPAAKTAAW